jgi:hypothetical protein
MWLNFLSGRSHLLGSVIIRAFSLPRATFSLPQACVKNLDQRLSACDLSSRMIFPSSTAILIVYYNLVMTEAICAHLGRLHVLLALLDVFFKHFSKPTNHPHNMF